jgi:hypothetical protein
MDNLQIYESVRKVPDNAKRSIQAGRLKGKTDINPMWRIKCLTEAFGPCGIGWKYTIREKRLEHGANGEISAFVDIDLYIKADGQWSEAIPGTGGSAFVAKEKSGMYTSDECFKMALTDAISVSCKALGMGADVYWDADRTKYSGAYDASQQPPTQGKEEPRLCADCGKTIQDMRKANGEPWPASEIAQYTNRRYGRPLCPYCASEEAVRLKNANAG